MAMVCPIQIFRSRTERQKKHQMGFIRCRGKYRFRAWKGGSSGLSVEAGSRKRTGSPYQELKGFEKTALISPGGSLIADWV